MAIHPKLQQFSKAKYIKGYSGFLTDIGKDLARLNCSGFNAEIVSFGAQRKSLLARLFTSPDRQTPEEVMTISTVLYRCPVEIALPISLQGIPMPYTLRVILPVAMTGRAECRAGKAWGGNGWHCEPPDKKRSKDLKQSLPSIGFIHRFGHVGYSVPITSTLQAIGHNKTEWLVHTVYEGTFSLHPRVYRYLAAIPTVQSLLGKWKK
jgi:hypothetical protein